MRAALRLSVTLIVMAMPSSLVLLKAQDATNPEPVRKILERHDQSGVTGKEIVIGTATLMKGSSLPFHTHPGDESGYVLSGPLVLKIRGQPDRQLKPGDSFFIARGTVHSLVAATNDGSAVSTWIIDKGSPLATPAP